MFGHKHNPYKDGLGDILTDCVSVELCVPHIHCFGGDGGGGGGGGGGSDSGGGSSGGGGGGSSGGGTIFGVNGVSKTGSTSQDAAIGWTSGEGSGQAGSNYDALQSATNSEVAQAQEMAASGSSTEEIGDYLSGTVTPDAGTVSTTTSGGNVESASEATAQQVVARPGTSAPQILRSYFDDLSTAITGGAGGAAGGATSGGAQAGGTQAATSDEGFDDAGFISAPLDDSAAAPNTLADSEALQRRIERRGDYLTAPGGASYNPPGYPQGMATPGKQRAFYREDAAGIMREMAPLTGSDITGVNKNLGLAGSDSGAFAVLTVDQMNELGASLNKKYGDSGYMNLGNMTPGAQAVAFSEISAKYPNQEYGRFDQRLGGQSIVRNMRLVGMNPETGSVMLEGGNKGFFGSGMASIFGLMAGGPVSTGLSMGGTANRIKNAAMDSDTGSIIGIGLDTLGLPGSAANEGLRMAGVDVNRYLPQLDTSVASNTSIFSDTGDSGSDTPAARPDPVTEPTQRPDPGISVSVPTTAARGLVKRKRLPGQDVYGVTGSDFPFLSLSDELQTSGLSSAVKGRPGRFTQNRPR